MYDLNVICGIESVKLLLVIGPVKRQEEKETEEKKNKERKFTFP